MLSVLEHIDPHSDRIDRLVDLFETLRPGRPQDGAAASARVRTLRQLLQGNPRQAARLRDYLARVLASRRHASLYTDIGILSNDGFFTELKRRIAYRILPPALGDLYLSDAIDQVLYRNTDHLWISAVPASEWLALFDVIAHARPSGAGAAAVGPGVLRGMLDAIRTLSCRVCALGLEPRLVQSHLEIENFDSPFLMQNIEVNDYLDGYAGLLDGSAQAAEDARHLLVMLDQCDAVVAKIRKSALSQGTSVALTYLLVALTQSIDRLRKLLFLVDVTGELPSAPSVDLDAVAQDAAPDGPHARPVGRRRAAAIALALELVQAHNEKYTVRDLLADNLDLLARNVTENASRTGEHYVAETRGELRAMFRSSAGAGVIVGLMALLKILTAYLRSAPLVEAFLFSLNYSLGFMLIHVLHFTVATKQPAMTAARIAAGLHSKDGRNIDLDSMAELINKVFRTQCVAVLGNLATAIPAAYALAACWVLATGAHLVSPEKAMHMLHDVDPFHSLALFYAAIAGACLFVAGLISGYYDNKALYTGMAQRVYQLRGLGRLLGPARLLRLANYIENNLGGLMGNLFFGILLGSMGTLGYLLGLPLDIRHVTFSSASVATAYVALGHHISLPLALTSIGGFLAIGAVNLVVSFGLALLVALRARKVRFHQGMQLVQALGRRLRGAPLDFLIGPKQLPAPEPPAQTTSPEPR